LPNPWALILLKKTFLKNFASVRSANCIRGDVGAIKKQLHLNQKSATATSMAMTTSNGSHGGGSGGVHSGGGCSYGGGGSGGGSGVDSGDDHASTSQHSRHAFLATLKQVLVLDRSKHMAGPAINLVQGFRT
jgi:hypothetical protein